MTHGILTFALIYAVDHDYDPFRPHNVIKKVSKPCRKHDFGNLQMICCILIKRSDIRRIVPNNMYYPKVCTSKGSE